MAKLWKVLKVVIFIWGALTLALVLYGLISTFVFPVFKKHGHHAATTPTEEVVFEKKDGGTKLVVRRKGTDGPDAYLLTLTKEGAPVVQNYHLPTEKYHLEYIRIYDASILHSRDSDSRIVLFSGSEEGEGDTETQIWFLKMTDTMNVREVIRLSDVHTTESNGLLILGNRYFGLPYQEDFHYEPFVVPVMVRVGDNISISPLLSPAGADALHNALQQEIKARMEKPSKNKEEKRGEQYEKVRKEMNEALLEKAIAY